MKKKLLLSAFLAFACGVTNAQNVIFEDGFESYTDFSIANVGSWTLNNINTANTGVPGGLSYANSGSPAAFFVFNSQTTSPNANNYNSTYNWNWSARTGDKAMISMYKTSGANNDWLISPAITLAASGNKLSFWAKSCSQSYSNELFKVGVSTTNTNTSSFTVISGANNLSTNVDKLTWKEYVFDLDAYAGQTIYISINCISNDQFGFAVDDFKVTSSLLATQENSLAKEGFKIYPNPAVDVVTLSDTKDVKLINFYDASGRLVKAVDNKSLKGNELSVSDLKSGIYVVDVERGNEHIKTKLIKK